MLDHHSLLGLYLGHTAPPHRVSFSPSHSRGIGSHRNRVQHVARHGRGGASGGDALARLSGDEYLNVLLGNVEHVGGGEGSTVQASVVAVQHR